MELKFSYYVIILNLKLELLIEPYGIEMFVLILALGMMSCLLIEPYGIEITAST